MTQMSSKCLLPLYDFINYPQIPGVCVCECACVDNGEDADAELPPI